jgi:hypothetical protein
MSVLFDNVLLRYQNGSSQMPNSLTQVQVTCMPLNAIPLLDAYHKKAMVNTQHRLWNEYLSIFRETIYNFFE